jgi:hypothetical protein
MDKLRSLDEHTQRRIVLQAAKACSPYMFDELRKEPKTVAGLDKDISDAFWGSVLLFWTVFIPLLCIPVILPIRRLRHYVRENWETLLNQEDEECSHFALVGDILHLLTRLPKSYQPQAKEVKAELERASGRWLDLHARLGQIRAALAAQSANELEARQQELEARIASESDTVTRTALQRQLEAVQGQNTALRDMEVWQERLQAAKEECGQELVHLRSRLNLLLAAGDIQENTAIAEATTSLQTLNTHLASTQQAVEEVLQIRAG